MEIFLLIVSLVIILIGAEIFVNGIEWLGKLFNLSEGAVGSVLAAVGTALPETLIPIIAIVFGAGGAGHDIGIGAILGAPLMLSTLAMFVTGLAVVIFNKRRATGMKVVAHYETMSGDLFFFILVFGLAVVAGFIPSSLRIIHVLIALALIALYAFYVRRLVIQEREASEEECMPSCYAAFGDPTAMECASAKIRVIAQITVALAAIIIGAHLFVDSVSVVATNFGVNPFILSLIIAPIATELPEKFNSIIWISRGKDTLALGNITGAMVFQSSLIPALGILLTDWQLVEGGTFIAAIIALASASLLFVELKLRKHISASMLLLAGVFYVLFILLVVNGFIR